ncbi:hypothetical protein B0A50_07607 [Salinomyces thailandicus]|uniref:Peptidase S26 domain-containing protein n=1 Tax=Salinomyces thailandicus TaxID=706561 RepID=A0A4U0TMN7_9PEZI|nr:hypothetical protein B0A50_07607 [Salinomyces thailandica]
MLPRVFAYSSNHAAPPNQSSRTPPPNNTNAKRQKLLRYLTKPYAAPPLLARFPTLHLAVRGLLFLLAAILSLHIFMEYFYTFISAWGISMLPTIASSGDWLLISKYYRRGRELGVGDVVSYKLPLRPGEAGVKRILGMPGDFVLAESPSKSGSMIRVPEGHCWIVGDNLVWSRDSRIFGPLPLALVTGKVLYKFSWTAWWNRIEHGLKDAEEVDYDVD